MRVVSFLYKPWLLRSILEMSITIRKICANTSWSSFAFAKISEAKSDKKTPGYRASGKKGSSWMHETEL